MLNFGTFVNIVNYDKYNADSMSWMNYYVGIYRKTLALEPLALEPLALEPLALKPLAQEPIYFVQLVEERVFFK